MIIFQLSKNKVTLSKETKRQLKTAVSCGRGWYLQEQRCIGRWTSLQKRRVAQIAYLWQEQQAKREQNLHSRESLAMIVIVSIVAYTLKALGASIALWSIT